MHRRLPLVWWLAGVFSALWLLAAPPVLADVPVPPLEARVTDLTDTLPINDRSLLESKLRDFESRKGSQIAVLIVPTTEPETIEQYSMRVAEAWKLGRKGVDDGVLLLIAKNDRKLRIEVGYGLEGAIPDAVAKRVISEVITPHFKRGNFSEGVMAGVEALIRLIDREPVPELQPKTFVSETLAPLLGIASALAFIMHNLLCAILGRGKAALGVAGLAGIAAWLNALSLVLSGVVALVVFVLVYFGAGHGGGWTSGGGGRSSGVGGFSGGGFGDGGGGFSGGGGGFGGGGASGDW